MFLEIWKKLIWNSCFHAKHAKSIGSLQAKAAKSTLPIFGMIGLFVPAWNLLTNQEAGHRQTYNSYTAQNFLIRPATCIIYPHFASQNTLIFTVDDRLELGDLSNCYVVVYLKLVYIDWHVTALQLCIAKRVHCPLWTTNIPLCVETTAASLCVLSLFSPAPITGLIVLSLNS